MSMSDEEIEKNPNFASCVELVSQSFSIVDRFKTKHNGLSPLAVASKETDLFKVFIDSYDKASVALVDVFKNGSSDKSYLSMVEESFSILENFLEKESSKA
jgi:hypothetical protein